MDVSAFRTENKIHPVSTIIHTGCPVAAACYITQIESRKTNYRFGCIRNNLPNLAEIHLNVLNWIHLHELLNMCLDLCDTFLIFFKIKKACEFSAFSPQYIKNIQSYFNPNILPLIYFILTCTLDWAWMTSLLRMSLASSINRKNR